MMNASDTYRSIMAALEKIQAELSGIKIELAARPPPGALTRTLSTVLLLEERYATMSDRVQEYRDASAASLASHIASSAKDTARLAARVEVLEKADRAQGERNAAQTVREKMGDKTFAAIVAVITAAIGGAFAALKAWLSSK